MFLLPSKTKEMMLVLDHDSDPLVSQSMRWKRSTWALWFSLAFLLSVDKGMFPLVLREADFASSAWQSPVPYACGAAIALCAAGSLFHQRSVKTVLALSTIINALTYLLHATSPSPRLCCFLRLCNGFIAVLPLLYVPLWVEEFGPPCFQGRWMILFAYIAPALGALAGYLMTFYLQLEITALILAGCLSLCALRILASSTITLQVQTLAKGSFNIPRLDSFSSQTVQIRQWWDDEPSSSKTVIVILGLVHCAGAPLLMYAPKVFEYDIVTVVILALCPFLGAPIGSALCRSQGGYKPGHAYIALRTLGLVLLLCLISTLVLFLSSFVLILKPIALACLLCCLGAAHAPAAGVLMTGSPSYHRPASSVFSAFCYQIFAYALATGSFSFVASFFNDRGEFALIVQVFATLSLATFCTATCYASFPKIVVPIGLSGIEIQKAEIEIEVARRRLLVSF